MRILPLLSILLFLNLYSVSAHVSKQDSIEVYLIDSFVPPENPDIFVVSFYTSDTCLSSALIDGKHNIIISETFTDNHRSEIDISKYIFMNNKVEFLLITIDAEGNIYQSEKYEFTIPVDKVVQAHGSNFISCLLGSLVFLTPSPTLILVKKEQYFSLSKDLPIVAFYSGGFNYPKSYLFGGYSYVIKFNDPSILRFGYKYLIEIPYFEFISPGLSAFSNLKGYNGLSSEITIGLFKFYSVFTLTTGGRYNFKPGTTDSEFWEFNIGLFSSFFTLHL